MARIIDILLTGAVTVIFSTIAKVCDKKTHRSLILIAGLSYVGIQVVYGVIDMKTGLESFGNSVGCIVDSFTSKIDSITSKIDKITSFKFF